MDIKKKKKKIINFLFDVFIFWGLGVVWSPVVYDSAIASGNEKRLTKTIGKPNNNNNKCVYFHINQTLNKSQP